MNTGKNLQSLLNSITETAKHNRDFVVPEQEYQALIVGSNQLAIQVNGHGFYGPTDHTLRQMSTHYGIPQRYAFKMKDEAPELLVDSLNTWSRKSSGSRMFRTNGHDLRAFLSDKYKIIDHLPVLESALQGVHDTNTKVVPLASELTPNRMYLKFLFPEIKADVKPGDSVSPGVVISNSEIGGGSFKVQGFFFREFCMNGCVFGQEDLVESLNRRHLGSRIASGEVVFQMDTIEAEQRLMAMQTRDILSAVSNPEIFSSMVERLQQAASTPTVENPEKAVEVIAKEYGLNEQERASALINLIEDKDYTQWGMVNAVTKIANTEEDFDRINELESMGAKLLSLQLGQFEKIRVAA